MLKSGGGAIVNMASIPGLAGFSNACAYVSAKHALLGLTRTAAMEHAPQDVYINVVGPTVIDTPLLSRIALTDIKHLRSIFRLHTCRARNNQLI